MGNESSLGLGI
jgi:hypothetical protein